MTTLGRRRLRLDALIVERGLASTIEHARALVLARDVRVDGSVATRAAAPLRPAVEIDVRVPDPYVSRGGEKLAAALDRWSIDVRGRRCMDVGASTGGFTDCLLQRGASSVIAVDAGYGQLADRLRRDSRVDVRERTNARTMEPLAEPVELATVDVSFISATALLPVVASSLRRGGDLLVLVKPQFEARRQEVQPGGVVRDSAVHASCVGRVARSAIELGLRVRGVIRSPLLGPAGNREFFLWLRSR